MQNRHRLAAWTLGVVLSGAAWPFAGFAFANVEVGQKVETAPLPTLDGAKHDVVAKKALANVFIFFRPRQEHSASALRQMAECQKEFAGKPVHWVTIVSGSWEKDEVRAFVKASGIDMPVLVDEGDELYGKLGVKLHPTVGIADGQGTLIAYEPFRKIQFCDIVRARIQYALKEIDAAEVEKAVHPDKALMPSDVPGAAANRHVRMGRMFVKMKNWEQAAASAREALARDPAAPAAHLLLGDALAGQGDCAAAEKEYDEVLRLEPANPAAADGKRACSPGR
jgi:tetratricopeptide (TPR) repeat protein